MKPKGEIIQNSKTPFNSSIRKSIVYSKLIYETRVFLLILLSLFNQHVNLFEFQFQKYNFRLFFYIFFLCSLKVLQRLKEVVSILFPINNFGILPALSFLQVIGVTITTVLFFRIYDSYNWMRVLFLLY